MTDHEDQPPPREVDLDRPGWARITDYLLRGKDNYAVDREVADEMAAVYGGLVRLAKAQRRFMMRAVRYQAAHLGVRQFLELGAGFPAATNTHDVAQDVDPCMRL